MATLNENSSTENLVNSHKITVESRSKTIISGITNVESANESGLVMYIGKTCLMIDGENLKVQKIDVDTGNVEVVGLIKNIKYSDTKAHRSILQKLTNKKG